MLTRWATPGNASHLARRVAALCVPFTTKDLPVLPDLKIIAESQKKSPPAEKSGSSIVQINGSELWCDGDGKLYTPQNDGNLQLRICVSAHCGLGGHRGISATKVLFRGKSLGQRSWQTCTSFVKAFFPAVFLPLAKKIPRLLGDQ